MDDSLDLVPRLKSLDGEAWEILDRSIRRSLQLYFLRRLTGSDMELAMELAQETLFRAVKSIRKYDESRGLSLRAWIFGIARHLYLNTLRRWHRYPEVEFGEFLPEQADPDDPSSWIGWSEDLKWALARLSSRQRTIFLAFEESGDTLAEIAADRGCTVGAVKAALFQARRNLQRLLLKRDPDLPKSLAPDSIHHPSSERSR